MNSQKLNDWLQIFGLFGVISSLIFVGLQLKQTQAIALSETYQNRTAANIEMNVAAMSSPEFLSSVSKAYQNEYDEFTMQEAVALEWYVGTNLILIEHNHFQFRTGYLSQEHWQKNLDELECLFTVPFFREIPPNWNFRESFMEVISDVMQKIPEIPADKNNCWSNDWSFPMR